VKAEEAKRRMEEENATLRLIHSSTKELQAAIKDEAKTFGGAMAMVYEEMSKVKTSSYCGPNSSHTN